MAFDFDEVKGFADAFLAAPPNVRKERKESFDEVLAALHAEFPAMYDSDLAAMAYFIARLMTAFLTEPLAEAADTLQNTVTGYLLAAAELTVGPLS